jgi:hypothetical protein
VGNKKVLIFFKKDSGSSFSILDGYKLWHMALMFFGKNELKSIFK